MADEELYDRIEELLDDAEAFWAIDVTDELIESLTLAYLDGLKGSAGYIGELAGVGLELTFDLVDPVALKFIEDRAAEMVRNVNNGTKHFLRTMIYNGVQEGIPEQDLIDGIYQNLFQQSDFSEQRIRSITRFEIARAQSDAWEKQMDEVGLETKRWVTIGKDACQICKGNEAMGPQPINSKPYDNVFGEKCEGPPAHPNFCRCHLAATPSEIAGLGKEIEFYVGKSEVEKGGKGSGHHGHKGVKGRRGGSAPSRGGRITSENFGKAVQYYGIEAVFNKSPKYKKDGGAYTLRGRDGENWGYVVKNRESGDWELRVDRWEGDFIEGKYERIEIAKFTDNLGKHDSSKSALGETTKYYAVTEKVTRSTRFKVGEAIPLYIDTRDWDEKNYKTKFKEATGHKLGDGVNVVQAKTMAEALAGAPQTGKPLTMNTYTSLNKFNEEYFGKPTGQHSAAYAFYQHSKTGRDGGSLHFGPDCSREIGKGRAFSTIRHEYGHGVDNSLRTGKWEYRTGLSKAQNIFAKAEKTGNFPRNYSRTNEREFFADSFELIMSAVEDRDLPFVRSQFPESHEMVSFVLGDRMPEEWK